MSFTDPIADMITRIRNAQLRTLNKVSITQEVNNTNKTILETLRSRCIDFKMNLSFLNNKKLAKSGIRYDKFLHKSLKKFVEYQR